MTLNKRLAGLLITAGLLLSIPLIAMQFTGQVNWSLADFMVGGTLLFGAALLIELAFRLAKGRLVRLLLCAAILLILFLIWAELAVGIFGTPWAGS